uniref:jerky protein homolog-like n=1 Tax=Osmia lignaria TaxID=473952 RepID=UPI0014796FA2|nr:jerky protein homolog-like [Osmia lignaria]
MSRSLFSDWFENHFKPSVNQFQEERGITGKVILFVDNCEAHKLPAENLKDEKFEIIFLPPNTTSLIQPMDQGVIEKTKRAFRHKLLQRVLTYDGGVQEFYKEYTLKNCIDIFTQAWSAITQTNLRNAWNQILGPVAAVQPPPLESDWQDMISAITGEDCSEQQVADFLSTCQKLEDKSADQEKHEDVLNEPQEEPPETMFEEDNDTIDDLRDIFSRLSVHSDRAPLHIQYAVQSLKIFFLNKE